MLRPDLSLQRLFILAALVAVGGTQASAQAGGRSNRVVAVTQTPSHATAPSIVAVRSTSAIVLDGRLDDAAWRTATPATEFMQTEPDDGSPASERTEVRIVYNDRAIYIGARLHDRGAIASRLGRRDGNLPDVDWFAVSLDGYHDHLAAAKFAVNPSGVVRDELMSGSNTFGGDASWDPVWQAKTQVDSGGWTVEMRIPLSQLRFAGGADEWGIQLERRIGRKNEHAVFSYSSRLVRGGVPRYGHLRGMGGTTARTQQIELRPYSLAKGDFRSPFQNSGAGYPNPYRDGSRQTAGYGVDLKYLPTSNVTIFGTVNPDFGQVELDPAVLNLSAFEVRFQERRPFFVEGSELCRFGGGDMGGGPGGGGGGPGGGGGVGGPGGFGGGGGGGAGPASIVYSRRIGRNPQLSVPSDAAYSDVPESATILGAFKTIARTSKGWSLGLIDAVTQREQARIMRTLGDESSVEVEPLTNYFAARVRRDLRAGQSSVGLLSTAVHRAFGDSLNADRLRSAAYVGGADFRHEWSNRSWSANGSISGSAIEGNPLVMVSAQRSSARYYQRPDADHLDLDSSATTMRGYAARLDIGKRSGTWRGNVAVNTTSPGYEVNDLGFQSAADRSAVDINLTYEQVRPGKYFRRWNARLGPDVSWNYGGERVETSLGGGGNGQFVNFWNFGYNYTHTIESLDDRLTRGGVLAAKPSGNSGFIFLSTDSRRRYTARVSVSGSESSAGDSRFSTDLDFSLRPGPNLELSVGPNWSMSSSAAQYITSISDATATATAGRRILFGELEQKSLSMETRLNVTFTPKLTLELFANPQLQSGDYKAFRELRAARTFTFNTFGAAGSAGTVTRDPITSKYTLDPDGAGAAPSTTISDPDFDFRSLRGNAVVRWEWRPGSTLFFVWQQDRTSNVRAANGLYGIGNFDPQLDGYDLIAIKPDNVFIVKATFWINP